MRTGSRITPAASASISVTPMARDACGSSTRTSTSAAPTRHVAANTPSPHASHLRTAPGNPWRSSILVSSAAPRWPPNPPSFGPPRRSRGSPLIHTDGDGDAGDDRVAYGYPQPTLHRPHRHLAVRQFALD